MSEADKRIGANLATLRGDMSQAALAAAMRERGWKWSQPTVAAIEKGERALKLAEAEELIDFVGAMDLEDLTTRPLYAVGWARLGAAENAAVKLRDAAAEFLKTRAALALVADQLDASLQEVPGVDGDEVEQLLTTPLVQFVTDLVPRVGLLPPSEGKYMRMLRQTDGALYREAEGDHGAAPDSAE